MTFPDETVMTWRINLLLALVLLLLACQIPLR